MPIVYISTPNDLLALMSITTPTDPGQLSQRIDYIVLNDIDMSGIECKSIASDGINNGINNYFNGNFDGGGYNIYINRISNTYNGFFKHITTGDTNQFATKLTIKNINLIYDSDILQTITGSTLNSGGLGGFISQSDILNCNVTFIKNFQFVNTEINQYIGAFGGIIDLGLTNTRIENCKIVIGDNFIFNGSSSFFVGRIAGNNILQLPLVKNVTVSVGNNCTVNASFSFGAFGAYSAFIAGFNGVNENVIINIGNNTTINGNRVGGVIGQVNASLTLNNLVITYGNNTIFNGVLSNKWVGGICGFLGQTSSINNCIVIYGNNTQFINWDIVGGICGRLDNTSLSITNTYCVYGTYSIIGSLVSPLIAFNSPVLNNTVLTYSLGGSLVGSNLTTISTDINILASIISQYDNNINTSLNWVGDLLKLRFNIYNVISELGLYLENIIYNTDTDIIKFGKKLTINTSMNFSNNDSIELPLFRLSNYLSEIDPSININTIITYKKLLLNDDIYTCNVNDNDFVYIALIPVNIINNNTTYEIVNNNIPLNTTIDNKIEILGKGSYLLYIINNIINISSNECFVCTADLLTSNPQITNYDESEDKSRRSNQILRSNVDNTLSGIINGTVKSPHPIFKSYQEMMMWKQGALKYRR
jgi:hypothetical protein